MYLAGPIVFPSHDPAHTHTPIPTFPQYHLISPPRPPPSFTCVCESGGGGGLLLSGMEERQRRRRIGQGDDGPREKVNEQYQ